MVVIGYKINVCDTLREAIERWRSYEESRYCCDSYEMFTPSDQYSGEPYEVQNGSGSYSLNNMLEVYEALKKVFSNETDMKSLWHFVGSRIKSILQEASWFVCVEGFVKELSEIIKQLFVKQNLRIASQASQSLFVSVVTGFLQKNDSSILPTCDQLPVLSIGDVYEKRLGVYYRTNFWVFTVVD